MDFEIDSSLFRKPMLLMRTASFSLLYTSPLVSCSGRYQGDGVRFVPFCKEGKIGVPRVTDTEKNCLT